MDNLTFSFTAMVRKEIQDETDRMTGKAKMISTVPIHLSIYSPNGVPLTNLVILLKIIKDVYLMS